MLPFRPTIPKNIVSCSLGLVQIPYALADSVTSPQGHGRTIQKHTQAFPIILVLRSLASGNLVHLVLSMPYLPVTSVPASSRALFLGPLRTPLSPGLFDTTQLSSDYFAQHGQVQTILVHRNTGSNHGRTFDVSLAQHPPALGRYHVESTVSHISYSQSHNTCYKKL